MVSSNRGFATSLCHTKVTFGTTRKRRRALVHRAPAAGEQGGGAYAAEPGAAPAHGGDQWGGAAPQRVVELKAEREGQLKEELQEHAEEHPLP
jgi:hypothetical protein